MIFYTLQGPGYKLEVHEEKMYLLKRGWLRFFSKRSEIEAWELNELSSFEITVPKFIFTGKVSWTSFDGRSGTFRFSTNFQMMKKIELYFRKRVMKNQKRVEKTDLVKPNLKISPTQRLIA